MADCSGLRFLRMVEIFLIRLVMSLGKPIVSYRASEAMLLKGWSGW